MQLGPKNPDKDGLLGPTSITVLCMEPLGRNVHTGTWTLRLEVRAGDINPALGIMAYSSLWVLQVFIINRTLRGS